MPAILTVIFAWLGKKSLLILIAVAAISALVSFSVWFFSFVSSVYNTIFSAVQSLGNSLSSSGLGFLNCLLNNLGIVEFFNSAIAIFISALSFWFLSYAYILTFILANKARNYIMGGL